MSKKEEQETPESLKQEFLEYKNTADKYFAPSLIGAIEVCIKYDAQYSYHHKLSQMSQAFGGDDRDEPRLYKILYDKIAPIMSFDFLTKEVGQTDADEVINDCWIRLAGFFALIKIDGDDFLSLSEIKHKRGYEFVKIFQKKLLNMLKNDITQMYAFQNRFYSLFNRLSVSELQKEYEKKYNDILAECKTIKGDFDKKYLTITEIAEQSKSLAEQYKKISIKCFEVAFAWFAFCWFIPYELFAYNYFGEIFVFLSKLLLKLPSFVLCLFGVKFLYLFLQYKTEGKEFSVLDGYLEKIPSDCTKDKAELVKQLAPHFFPDKKANKISQGFLQELMLKMVEKPQLNTP